VSTFSLPKYLIIKKSKEFNEIFTCGEMVRSKYFIAFIQKDNDLKIGFTAQKGLKTKVVRNRLKRRTRELWRLHFRDFSLSGRIVLMAKKNADGVKFSFLQEDFLKLLKKLTN